MMSRTRLPIAIAGLRFFTSFPTRVPTSTPTRFNTRLLACFVASLILSVCGAEHLCAQTQFELGAPGLNRTSKATIAGRELRIVDQTGRETVYFREPGMDTADGQFTAYRSTALAQVIRWPTSNNGPMQIGTVVGAGYEFRTSQMQVMPIGGLGDNTGRRPPNPGLRPNRLPLPNDPTANGRLRPDELVLPPNVDRNGPGLGIGQEANFFGDILRQRQPQPQVLRLTMRDDRGRDWYLGKSGSNRLAMHGAPNPNVSDWYIVPAGRGYVRVCQQISNQWLTLSVTQTRGLIFEPLGQQASQLWHVMQTNLGSGYWLESAVAPGYALTGAVSGSVNLLPISGGFGQVWLPQPIVVTPGFEPLWRTVSHDIRPNPPLAPAQIEVLNSHNEALRILVADRRIAKPRELRIEKNSRVVVPFDRDSGATVVETYEIRGPSGLWDRQQFVTQIPPEPIYDLSVYEEFLQSIAIDRTGTSPNPIEDINYQPKSVGWLPLPPGAALPDRGQIDAYQDAKAANNPGAVRRFDRRDLEKPNSQPDPLKSILDDVAPKARQKF